MPIIRPWGEDNESWYFAAPFATTTYTTCSTTTNYYWDTSSADRWTLFSPLTFNGQQLEASPFPSEVAVAGRVAQQDRVRRAEERVVAQSRAVELLVSLLPPEQVTVFREHGHFEITGSHGTRYRVNEGVSGNIEWLRPTGEVGGRLCAHPTMQDGWLPTADVMLSQLLALTADEREFLRLANVHAGRRPELAAA
jgi:hypothetical protein